MTRAYIVKYLFALLTLAIFLSSLNIIIFTRPKTKPSDSYVIFNKNDKTTRVEIISEYKEKDGDQRPQEFYIMTAERNISLGSILLAVSIIMMIIFYQNYYMGKKNHP